MSMVKFSFVMVIILAAVAMLRLATLVRIAYIMPVI
jgi:hypothetical protein